MHGDVSQFKTASSIFAFQMGYNCQGEWAGLAGRKVGSGVCVSGEVWEIINGAAKQEGEG